MFLLLVRRWMLGAKILLCRPAVLSAKGYLVLVEPRRAEESFSRSFGLPPPQWSFAAAASVLEQGDGAGMEKGEALSDQARLHRTDGRPCGTKGPWVPIPRIAKGREAGNQDFSPSRFWEIVRKKITPGATKKLRDEVGKPFAAVVPRIPRAE